jgi:hypothetical protein
MKTSGIQHGLLRILFILLFSGEVHALPYEYPGIRYVSPMSHSLGGITLPLNEGVGNSLFNNPAALARNTMFRAEYLNLNLDLNSGVAGNFLGSTGATSLGGFTTTLNQNPNQLYGLGGGNLTAVSWGGLAFGILVQERNRAYSDGSQVHYETMSQIIPAIGYGLGLARGVVRIGYSMQLVNEASGISQSTSDSSAGYLKGISAGMGISHTASVNFAFPYQYLPTFSLLARNVLGMKFNRAPLFKRADTPSGSPSDQPASYDAAFNFMIRVSGPLKANGYVQYKDLLGVTSTPVLDRISAGLDLSVSPAVSLRVGAMGLRLSGGIGYRSQSSEINLAYYKDPCPFTNITEYDTRFALQYKVFFQNENSREREPEMR